MWQPWWKNGNPTHALNSCNSNILTKPTWPWMVPGGHQQLYTNHAPRAMHGFLVDKMAEKCRLTANARCGVESGKRGKRGGLDLKLAFIPARISSCCGDAISLAACVQSPDLPRAIEKKAYVQRDDPPVDPRDPERRPSTRS